MGGKPSRGTPADRRLKSNRPQPPAKAPSKPTPAPAKKG